jgi:DNA end-binding protein Ku
VRSVWTGAIEVIAGLNMPIKLGSATKDNKLGLHMVRKSDGSRVKQQYIAEKDGEEVPFDKSAKGYDAPDGSLVILDKPDFEKAFGPKNRVATVLMFTDEANIPPMAAKTAYWVQPDIGGEKTYALFADLLQSTGKVAVLTFAMRQREAVAVLRPHDGYLALESLEWDTDILRPDFAAPPQTASDTDRELASQLIATMDGKYDHAAQIDRSAESLNTVIQEKIEAGQVVAPPPRPDNVGAPQDLTAMLTAAVNAQKKPEPAKARSTNRKKAA